MTLPRPGTHVSVKGQKVPSTLCHMLFLFDKPADPPGEAGACPRSPNPKGSADQGVPAKQDPTRTFPLLVQLHGRPRPEQETRDVRKRTQRSFHIHHDPWPGSPWSLEVGVHGSGCSALSGHAMALCPWPRSLGSFSRSPAEVNQQRVSYPSVANQSPINSMGLEIIPRSRGVGTRGARVGTPQEGREESGSRVLRMKFQELSLENL